MPKTYQITDFTLNVCILSELPSNVRTMESFFDISLKLQRHFDKVSFAKKIPELLYKIHAGFMMKHEQQYKVHLSSYTL